MKINKAIELINHRIDNLKDLGVVEFCKITSSKKSINSFKACKGQYFVYFILERKEVTYIGSTKNILTRMSQHRMSKFFNDILLIKFNTFEDMKKYEKEFIITLTPIKNTIYNRKNKQIKI